MNPFNQNQLNNLKPTNSSPYLTQNITNSSSYSNNTETNSTIYEKGSILKGEITDLRYHEIQIKLEDNTTITAKYANTSDLSIGQTATFEVTESSPSKLSLKILPDTFTNGKDNTITKALDEAFLPKNEKNIEIVKELLKNQMSIDKHSILNILKQTYLAKDTNIQALVLMNKQGIPFTVENARIFEEYQNFEHSTLKDINQLISDLPNILINESKKGSFKDFSEFLTNMINFVTNHDSEDILLSQKNMLPNQDTLQQQNSMIQIRNLDELSFAFKDQLNMDSDTTSFLSSSLREDLARVLSPFSLPDDMNSSIINGTANLRELMNLVENVMTKQMDTESSLTPSSNDTNQIIHNRMEALNHPLVSSIFDIVSNAQKENEELSSILSYSERFNLSKSLDGLPLPNSILHSIQKGDITITDLLTSTLPYIQNSDENSIHKLFQRKEYQSILKEELLAKWTLTPEQLTKENSVQRLYHTLDSDLDKLKEILHNTQSNMDTSNTLHTIQHLKENIDFMKTVNQLFTYVQLPLKLMKQNVHSDLYVYTNKKQLQKSNDNITAFLHLDMDHLGPLDIHIALMKSHIVTKFYLEDEQSKELASLYMDQLKASLEKKGYRLNYELYKREKPITITDFMEKDKNVSSVQRFSFDIRA